MKKSIQLTATAFAVCLVAESPAHADVIATCGASYGQARYDGEAGWTPDSITKGTFTFVMDGKGNPNVIFKDTRGSVVDAAADGGQVRITFAHPDREQFGFAVVYEDDGLVETYNIFRSANGRIMLHWTSNKAQGFALPKVAAFRSTCE